MFVHSLLRGEGQRSNGRCEAATTTMLFVVGDTQAKCVSDTPAAPFIARSRARLLATKAILLGLAERTSRVVLRLRVMGVAEAKAEDRTIALPSFARC